MSIFSKLKASKKAAEQHKGAKAQKAEEKPAVSYKHVVTHAAIDALSGAPSSWKEKDREEIKFQNRRRSAMMRSNSNLSQVTNPIVRNSSNLSQVTSINTNLNRNNSYMSSDSSYSQVVPPKLETRKSHIGYQGYNNYSNQIGKSPLASNQISPIASSGNSTSSSSSRESQILELPSEYTGHVKPQENNIFQHLHTNPNRTVGEAPLYDVAPTPQFKPKNVTTVTATQAKRRTFGFGKRSSAIAAH